jgi:hypothetical protein
MHRQLHHAANLFTVRFAPMILTPGCFLSETDQVRAREVMATSAGRMRETNGCRRKIELSPGAQSRDDTR